MAEPLIVDIKLAPKEISETGERIKRQLQSALDTSNTQSEAKERVHQQRIEAIRRQSAAALQQIEARKQAQLDLIRERAVQKEIEQQRRLERAAQTGGGAFQTFLRRFSSTIREAGESIQQAGFAFQQFITGPLIGLGRAAVRSAIDIDRQVNVLKSLTGSAEQAEKRFAQLVATAQRTPGLTTNLAATLDTQLRVANVTEQTINRILPAIGRLNAVSPLGDPQKLAQNLVQLVTQNFEKTDLKELVGQSPLAGEIIKSIFNVDSPTNAKAIREAAKKLGIDTTDEFFTAFAQAAANNQKLQNVTESLGTQFEKLRDRAIVALRPIGLTIVQTLAPLVERAIPIIERISDAFAELPEPVRQAIVISGAFAAALGPIVIAAGGLIQAFGALGNIITVVAGAGGIGALASALPIILPILAAITVDVGVLAAAFATNFAGIRDVVTDVISFAQARFKDLVRAFEDNRGEIDKLIAQFGRLSEEARPLVKLLGEVFKFTLEKAFKGAIVVADTALTAFNFTLQKAIDGFQTLKNLISESAAAAAQGFGTLIAPFTGLGTVLGDRVRSALTPGLRGTGEGLDGEEITLADFAKSFEAQRLAAEEARQQAARSAAAREAGASAKKSEIAQLVDQTKELNREIAVLRSATGPEFNLQVRQDDLQATKKVLEEIIQRRAQIGFTQIPIAPGTEQNTLRTLKTLQEGALPTFTPPPQVRTFPGGSTADASLSAEQVARFERLNQLEAQGLTLQQSENALRLQEVRIQNQIEMGVFTEVEGRQRLLGVQRQHRDEILRALEAQRGFAAEMGRTAEVSRLDIQIEQTRMLGVELSNAQRFARGFGSQIASAGDIFERFGQNVSRALTNTRDLLNGLKQSVIQFFNDLLGQSLQNLMRSVLAPIVGGLGGLNPAAAGGGIFRTPPTFPANFSGSAFQNIANAIGAGGGGAAALPSLTSGIAQFFGSSVPRTAGVVRGGIDEFIGAGVPRTAGQLGIGALLGGLFKGFGFGLKPGSATGSFAAAAPLLGLTLGAGLGGQSRLGQILGGAGGALAGIGLTAAPSIFAAGGSLASPAIAGLFSNPITAIVGAGLLVGSIFLGKASQRRKDEEASGQMLTAALDAITQLKAGIASDQIDGNQAGDIFDNQILGPFVQQIRTLKTKSVVESRLKNQTNDLRRTFDALIPPEVEAQRARKRGAERAALIDSRLIPQFATGGISSGGLAVLHPAEMVLTPGHQSALRFMAGSDVFERIGVPGVQQQAVFDRGGIMPSGASPGTIVIQNLTLVVDVGMSQSGAEEIVVAGLRGRNGEDVIVDKVQTARRRGRRV